MSLNLNETLRDENKTVRPGDPLWEWDMVRTVAALFNFGGGTLRAGVDNSGNAVGFNNLSDYEPDKGELAKTLAKYLTRVPYFFNPTQKTGYIEVRVSDGVTFPVILKENLVKPSHTNPKEYVKGTVFTRTMDGPQVCSRPPQTAEDWQTMLHVWETNRGVTVQGPLVAQFCLVINRWDPFNPSDTDMKKWEAKCVADTAQTLGREKLWTGLISIWKQMQLSTRTPSLNPAVKDQEGSIYKQPLLREVEQLCQKLGLSVKGGLGS